MNPVEVRTCKTDDLPEVVDLMRELSIAAHASEDFQLDNVKRVFDDMENYPEIYLNLVALLSGRVIGFIPIERIYQKQKILPEKGRCSIIARAAEKITMTGKQKLLKKLSLAQALMIKV